MFKKTTKKNYNVGGYDDSPILNRSDYRACSNFSVQYT